MKKLIGFITIISAVLFLVSCSGKDFTVTFDTDGGSPQVESQKVKKGDYAKLPTEEVKKEGYSFEYWSLDGSEFKFTETKIEKDITIVASWKSNNPGNNDKVTITFNTDGGNLIDPISIDKGTKLPTVTAPTKNGWTFKGWMIGKVDFNLDTLINEDTTLTAKWELIDEGVPPVTGEELTHEFDFSTLTIDGTYVKTETPVSMVNKIGNSPFEFGRLTAQISQPETQYVPEGKTVPVGIVLGLREKNDWSDAYLVSKTAVEGLSKIEIDFTVWGDQGKQNLDYAEGIYIQSSVDGITWVNEANLKDKLVDESYYQGVESFSITEGSKFARIFVKSNGIPSTKFQMRLIVHGIKFYTGNDDVPPVGDTHRVIFDLNYEGSSAPTVKPVADGNKVVAGPNPTRAGYTFKYWALDNKEFDFNQTITEQVHLRAVWEENDEVPPTDGDVEINHDYDFSKGTLDDKLSSEEKDVSIPNAADGDQIDFVRKNSRLYTNSYNSFTGVALVLDDTSSNATYLASKTKVKSLTKIDVKFSSWGKPNEKNLQLSKGIFLQISSDGTTWVDLRNIVNDIVDSEANYIGEISVSVPVPGDYFVRIIAEPSGEKTGYAMRFLIGSFKFHTVSEPFTGQTFTVSFDSDGGSSIPSQTVREGRAAKMPNVPSKKGFKFTGWYLDGLNTQFDFATIIDRDLTLKAKWEVREEGDNPSDNDPNIVKYYVPVAGVSGPAFKPALDTLIKTTGIATNSTGSTANVKRVDTYEGKNYNIYDGFGSYGNREHVWPNSKLGNRKYDLHNLRAAVINTNSTRSNYPFGEGSGGWKLSGGKFYPGDEHIGDVARIVLYIHILESIPLDRVGNLPMFLKWHEQDPVSDFERSRNNNIQDIQSNRNPFIDYPEFAEDYFSITKVQTALEELLDNMNLGSFLSITDVDYELLALVDKREYIS